MLGLLLFIHVIVRIPTFYEPAFIDDENFYISIGRSMLNGSVLYKDISDIHAARLPFIYLIAGVAGNNLRLRLFALIANSISLLFLFALSYFFSKKMLASGIISLAYIVLSSSPFIGGNTPHDEIFFLPFVLSGLYVLMQGLSGINIKQTVAYCGAGFLLGLGATIKIHALFNAIAVIAALIVIIFKQVHITWLKILRVLLFVLLLFTPLLITITILFLGGLSIYDFLTLFENGVQMSSYAYSFNPASGYFLMFFTLFYLCLVVFLSNRLNKYVIVSSLWFFSSVLSSLLVNSIGSHYSLQSLPLLLTYPLYMTRKTIADRILVLLPVCLFIFSHLYIPYSYTINPDYYINFFRLLSRSITKDEYYATFSATVPRNHALADFLSTLTKPEEKIFVWGLNTEIYTLTNTLPSTKYIWPEHIEALNAYTETIRALEQKQVRYAVVFDDNPMPNQQLLIDYISANYTKIAEFGTIQGNKALLYRRLPVSFYPFTPSQKD